MMTIPRRGMRKRRMLDSRSNETEKEKTFMRPGLGQHTAECGGGVSRSPAELRQSGSPQHPFLSRPLL